MSEPEGTWYVTVREPGLPAGHPHPLRGPSTTIGKSPSCDIVLSTMVVSRDHGAIVSRRGRWYFEDHGSKNGSSLNGHPVSEPVELAVGDVVRLANAVTLSLVRLDTPTPQPEHTRLEVHIEERRAWVEGVEIKLARREFELLSLLYQNRPRVCSHAEIGEAIWGASAYGRIDVQKLVQLVRRKIERDPANPQHVVNVKGVGYRLDL